MVSPDFAQTLCCFKEQLYLNRLIKQCYIVKFTVVTELFSNITVAGLAVKYIGPVLPEFFCIAIDLDDDFGPAAPVETDINGCINDCAGEVRHTFCPNKKGLCDFSADFHFDLGDDALPPFHNGPKLIRSSFTFSTIHLC